MAEIQLNTANKAKKRRAKIVPPRLDMTPMVDLAFLLLTFFVLTATFDKPKSMELTFPVPDGEQGHLKKGITFLLTKNNRIFYYEGELRSLSDEHKPKTQLHELRLAQTDQSSLRAFLRVKNKAMQDKIRALSEKHNTGMINDSLFHQGVLEAKSGKDAFTYLIKPDADATYGNVIDVIDELNINVVGKYVVTDLVKQEQELINERLAVK